MGFFGDFLNGAVQKAGEINDEKRKSQVKQDERRAELFDSMNLQEQLAMRKEQRDRARTAEQTKAAMQGDLVGAGLDNAKAYSDYQAQEDERLATKAYRDKLMGGAAPIPANVPTQTTQLAQPSATTATGGINPLPASELEAVDKAAASGSVSTTQAINPAAQATVSTAVKPNGNPNQVKIQELENQISYYNNMLIGAPKSMKDSLKATVDNLQQQLKATQDVVTKDDDISRKADEKQRLANVDRLKDVTKSADAASKARSSALSMQKAVLTAGYTGTGGSLVGAADKLATGLGQPDLIEGDPSSREVINKESIKSMSELLDMWVGAISDRETGMAKSATANVDTTPEGIRKLTNITIAGSDRSIERKQFMETWLDSHGGKAIGMDEAWGAYIDNNPVLNDDFSINHEGFGKWKDYLDDTAKAAIGYNKPQSQSSTSTQPKAPTQAAQPVISDPSKAPSTVMYNGKVYKK